MQKTFTVDCFSHKSRKNNGEKTQYILEHGIPSIISDKKWALTQNLLKHPNYKLKSTKVISMPRLYIKRIKSGKLRNYIVFDPSWKTTDIKEVFK